TQVTLQAGLNQLTAKAQNRGGFGPTSQAISITLDNSIPDAPLGMSAQSREAGVVRLSWQALESTDIQGYFIYRSDTPFTQTTQAELLNTQEALNASQLDDITLDDGTYYYAVTSVNKRGTESVLSKIVTALADGTAPHAISITYESNGVVDPQTGRMAPGQVSVQVTVSEALLTTPFLSLAPHNGVPMTVSLTKTSDTLYEGQLTISDTTPSGTAYAVFSARDVLGNRGTEILSGGSLPIDTDGPAVTQLSVTPQSPIKNDTETTVNVSLTLDEPVKTGSLITLNYLLSGANRTAVIINNLNAVDETHYQGSFTLPADAGLSEVETFKLLLEAEDDLGNQSKALTVYNQFQVYQGDDLPPLDIPTDLQAKVLAQGKVELSWASVEGAAYYQLYRQGSNETVFTALKKLTQNQWTDQTHVDGEYHYQVTSIREANAQERESAHSPSVTVITDASAPEAPTALSLDLIAQGIKGEWTAVSGEVTYSVYRSNSDPITTTDGMTPLYQHLGSALFVDANPSITEHAYVVTAVDSVGNESAPSNTVDKNFGLLPVNQFSVTQTDEQAPELSWTHNGSDIAGYELHLQSDQYSILLHSDLLSGLTFTDSGYSNDTRHYQLTVVDNSEQRSLSRSLVLPKIQITPQIAENEVALKRGIMNQLSFKVENLSEHSLNQVTLQVQVAGKNHHSAQSVTVPAQSSVIIPIVIGGYEALQDLESLSMTLMSTPDAGESITLIRHQDISVGDGVLLSHITASDFTRGAQGEVSFSLENHTEVDVQLMVAQANNGQASDEIRFQLMDVDENVLGVYPFKQGTGNQVKTLSNGMSVLTIPAKSDITSAPMSINIPEGAPDLTTVRLEIDAIHYQLSKIEQASIKGLSSEQDVLLQVLPYSAQVNSVLPEISHGEEDIVITGQAIDSVNQSAFAQADLKLYISSEGFTRSFDIVSDHSGQFSYTFKPLAGESGHYSVSVVHPERHTQPVMGQFSLQKISFSPARFELSVPRNYSYDINLTLDAGQGLPAKNLHLEYLDADQSGGVKAQDIELTLPSAVDLSEGQRKTIKLGFQAGDLADESGSLILKVKSDDYGATPVGTFTLNYQLQQALPTLNYSPNYLETGVVRGDRVTETITLSSAGLTALTDINLSLLDKYGQEMADDHPEKQWVGITTPTHIERLEVGESSAVRFQIQPVDSAAEGYYEYILRVKSSNHPTRDIKVYVSITQSGIGHALFRFSDIYTATPQNGVLVPGLSGVKITLQNELVPTLSYSRNSDQNGEALFTDLPAGYYRFRASALNHSETAGRLQIKPVITASKDVFMDYNLVTVEWEVNEITIEDKYEIVLHAVYEADVPAAVVVAEP
ncbi:MAG: hypothetical protein GY814_17375, partial [Gammaproteobacteria bacterium]|nr:hypothetical protein [Gammaproteobacteria bacterium]